MSPDEKDQFYTAGFKAGKKHSTMSDETSNCINNLNNRMAKLEDNQDELKKQIEDLPTKAEMKLSNRELLEEMMDKAEGKFAPKWVEWVVGGIAMGIVLLGLAITITVLFGQQLPIDISL